MQEMVSCCVAVSNKPNPLKNVLPKKRSTYAKKPNCFHNSFSSERVAHVTRPAPSRVII
jgi:hypothetical protein